MSQLPNSSAATIDDTKITQYLLNTTHPTGSGKAKFFNAFGYSHSNWLDFKRALLDHPQMHSVTSQTSTGYGEKYTVSCSIKTPYGLNPCIISVWIIEPSDPAPRFVTAYAGP
jgi:hypothetical protein